MVLLFYKLRIRLTRLQNIRANGQKRHIQLSCSLPAKDFLTEQIDDLEASIVSNFDA